MTPICTHVTRKSCSYSSKIAHISLHAVGFLHIFIRLHHITHNSLLTIRPGGMRGSDWIIIIRRRNMEEIQIETNRNYGHDSAWTSPSQVLQKQRNMGSPTWEGYSLQHGDRNVASFYKTTQLEERAILRWREGGRRNCLPPWCLCTYGCMHKTNVISTSIYELVYSAHVYSTCTHIYIYIYIYIYMHVHRGGCDCTLALLRMLACISFGPFGAKSSDSSARDKEPQRGSLDPQEKRN